MADDTDLANGSDPVRRQDPDGSDLAAQSRHSAVMRGALAGAGAAAIVLAIAWGLRERIATTVIDRELAALRLPARYRVTSIGLGREVLSDIVVGNPAHPDLTIERADITVGYGLGGPRIDHITLVRPRLHARLITAPADGSRLSLGSLDTLVYGPSAGPVRLPDWSATLVDARARVDSDYGVLGVALSGQGRVSDGFSGTLAATVPAARMQGVQLKGGPLPPECVVGHTALTGALTTRAGLWQFAGPLQTSGAQCGVTQMGPGTIDLALSGDPGMTGGTLGGKLALGRIDLGPQQTIAGLTIAGLGGQAGLHWRAGKDAATGGDLAGRLTLVAAGLATPDVRVGQLRIDGAVHVRSDPKVPGGSATRLDFRGDIDGHSLTRGAVALAAMARLRAASAGTPLAALLDRADAALSRDEPGSHFAGSVGLRSDAAGWRIAVPVLTWRGGQSGQTLARIDHFALIRQSGTRDIDGPAAGVPRMAGNFTTGGRDLPVVAGTVTAPTESGPGAATRLHLTMARYAAGPSQLAVPDVTVKLAGDGTASFAGKVAVSGPLGQGSVAHLVAPVDGMLGRNGTMTLLRHCIAPRFDGLHYGTLDLGGGTVTVCPVGGAIVRSARSGVAVAATIPAFAVQGSAGGGPIVLRTGGARIAWPGTSTITGVDVALASRQTGAPDHLHVDSMTLTQPRSGIKSGSGGEPAGTFIGGTIAMAALPANISAAQGSWRIAGGRLILDSGAFVAADRMSPARFAPVAVRDVAITLANGTLDATARMMATGPVVELGTVAVHHDLGRGTGHADVVIPGLTFRDPAATAPAAIGPAGNHATPAITPIQPSDLSVLAKGVVAAVNGTIKGRARFDWNTRAPGPDRTGPDKTGPDKTGPDRNGGSLTTSGTFSTDALDFAAAAGPVEGVSGTIAFTDLLNLVTAPHQVLKIARFNPGIDVADGTADFALRPGGVVQLNAASWPFDGGTLRVEPAELHLGSAAPYHLDLVITGLKAPQFLQRINMANLEATGVFDGRLPLVFDANGGRIVGGALVSRPPGGNVSYVGALTYRDLSPMANYAFRMLRSVDYTTMTIGLEGDLAGEFVTHVSFGGIHQGKGAQRNLITRELAHLPLQFDVNVRSQFSQLLGSMRSLYDPSLVPDPRTLGLVDAQGRPIHRQGEVSVGSAATGPATGPASGPAAHPAGAGAGQKRPIIQPSASGTMP